MARALGSYPGCHRFKSSRRYHSRGALPLRHLGPLVKWLRHRPFTAVTWVRIPYGSPRQKKPDPFRFRPVERPETAHTQVPSSFSPQKLKTAFAETPGPGAPQFGGLAQLVRALASHARGHWFESSSLHQKAPDLIRGQELPFLRKRTALTRGWVGPYNNRKIN